MSLAKHLYVPCLQVLKLDVVMSLSLHYKESKLVVTRSDALISFRVNCFHVLRFSCFRPLRQKKLEVLLCLGLMS